MKRVVIPFMAVMIAAWALFPRQAPAAADIPNPSFEQPDPKNPDLPLGYAPVRNKAAAGVQWDRRTGRTGRASLYVRNDGPDNANWQLLGGFEVVPNVKYTVSVWIKLRNASGFSGVSVRYRSGAREWLGAPLRLGGGGEGTADWHQIRFTLEPPDDARNVILFFGNSQGQGGEVWFDDLAVENALQAEINAKLPQMLQQNEAILKGPADDTPAGQAQRDAAQQWRGRALAFQQRAARAGGSNEELAMLSQEWTALNTDFQQTQRRAATTAAAREFARTAPQPGGRAAPFVAGWQNALTRVWLRDRPNRLHISATGHLDVMRGETEAIQLAIQAVNEPLRGVRVNAGDLSGAAGRIAGGIALHPVGSVRIERPNTGGAYPVEVDYKGWWPEILLDNFAFDVAQGDTVPVWIAVTVPRNARPGVYTAPIDITTAGAAPVRMNLEVQVWNVDLPATWRFRNLMSFNVQFAQEFYENQWSPALRQKFLDFLTARRINLTTIYREDFTWEEISRAARAGQNTIIVDTIAVNVDLDQSGGAVRLAANEQARVNEVLNAWMPRLRQAGWLDRTYFYGFDEVKTRQEFENARQIFGDLKRRYAGLQIMSTLKDSSYGQETGLADVVDAFVPLMPFYDPARATRVRARGDEVWWYATEWNIEQPLSRSRLIPWMTAKAGSDGFVIWVINRWKGGKPGESRGRNRVPRHQWSSNNRPVQNQILNEWDPWLDGATPNSTGCYLYPGANGPLSSLRLENFRDGIEEYDLLLAARDRLAQLRQRGADSAKIQQLAAAVTLEDGFIRDGVKADYNPAALYTHRQRLLQAMAATAP
jgi:Domain of unknown function (DUF4091)/Family of unknown function (DUF6067)